MSPTTTKRPRPYAPDVLSFVRKHHPCDEARDWLRTQPSMAAAWDACQRSDWMLWALERTGYNDERTLRLLTVWCARQVEHLMTDPRSRAALDVAERYANGLATREELAAAREAAWEAAWAPAWEAAWAAAGTAAGTAAWAAAGAAAGAAVWAKQAARIREVVPNPFAAADAALAGEEGSPHA